MKTTNVVALLSATAITLAWGCSTGEERLGIENEQPAGSFVSADSGSDATSDAVDPNAGFTNYCPSNKCGTGRTTCPGSRFPCDIDLRSDPNNCGSCGFACPKSVNGGLFTCADGKCQMACADKRLDCNGIVDDGCEANIEKNDNCAGCGIECNDPAKPCVHSSTGLLGCGCNPTDILCPDSLGQRHCLDPSEDDKNCGACDHVCDPTLGVEPPLPNTYYGCSDSECGHSKCNSGMGNCNGIKDDGCETPLSTDENCGGCGKACPAGQGCYLSIPFFFPECMCPPGKTLCTQAFIFGSCFDLANDPSNCGGCGSSCPGYDPNKFIYPVCKNGSCETACLMGRADCNGNIEDGCEVDTDYDPRNCGECGHVCDAIVGQACIGGRCAVEPCDVDAGEVTR